MTQRQVYTDTIKVRVYLEGVLFPYVKSVTVTEGEGTVSASIEVPPSLFLRPDELAGMTCHIFYANKRVLSDSDDPGDNNPPIGTGWPILFQGEMAGESVSTSVQSENVVLTFTSHARHFEQTQLYFYDTSRQENVLDLYKRANFLGNTQINLEASGTALDKKTQILTTLTRRISELEEDEERNIAFTACVLEILRSTGDQHAIFGYFDKKFKLSNRFAAYADPDVKNILALEQFKTIIDQMAQGLPSHASLMQLLDVPTSLMKYNWNQLAQPRLRPERLPDTLRRTESADDLSRKIRKATQQFAENVVSGATINTVLGPVDVPDDYLSISSESSKGKGTYVELAVFVSEIFVQYEGLVEEFEDDSEDDLLLRAFQSQVNDYKIPTLGKLAEKKKKEEVQNSEGMDEQAVLDSNITEDQQTQKTQDMLEADQRTLTERDELNEFTITPNMEFSHPPTCNVLFPASFGAYGMTRNHLQEPTRMYGRVDIMPAGRDEANTAIEWYIAPTSQAFHYLDGTNLARYSEAYAKFISQLPNQLSENPDEEPE